MKLIILSGESHCGKTTTLKHVCQLLGNGNTEIFRKEIDNPEKDIECVFQCGEKKVAVCTMGDYNWIIKTYGLRYADCNVLICALNSGFMRNTKYKPFEDVLIFDPRPTIVLKRKETDENLFGQANDDCADYLLRILSVI